MRRLSVTPPNHDFTGVAHATKYTVVKENEFLSDYNDVNHCAKQDNKIRSNIDNVSLNKSMTSSLQHEHGRRISIDEQLSQQWKQTNEGENNVDHDVYSKLNQQAIVHSMEMNDDIRVVAHREDDNDDGGDDYDGHYTDESNYSDDLKLVLSLSPSLFLKKKTF